MMLKTCMGLSIATMLPCKDVELAEAVEDLLSKLGGPSAVRISTTGVTNYRTGGPLTRSARLELAHQALSCNGERNYAPFLSCVAAQLQRSSSKSVSSGFVLPPNPSAIAVLCCSCLSCNALLRATENDSAV